MIAQNILNNKYIHFDILILGETGNERLLDIEGYIKIYVNKIQEILMLIPNNFELIVIPWY